MCSGAQPPPQLATEGMVQLGEDEEHLFEGLPRRPRGTAGLDLRRQSPIHYNGA